MYIHSSPPIPLFYPHGCRSLARLVRLDSKPTVERASTTILAWKAAAAGRDDILVEHGNNNCRYNYCWSILWPLSYPWSLILARTLILNSYAALATGAQDWVRRTHGRGMDLRYTLSRVLAHPLRVLGVCALGSTAGIMVSTCTMALPQHGLVPQTVS